MRNARLRTAVVGVAALATAAALLVGCSRDDQPGAAAGDAAASDGKVKIGLVQINQQAIFFNQMNDGAQEAAAEAGAELTIFNANDDPVQQNQAVQNFVQQGFDAVIVVAIDVEGIKPAVQQAASAGLKVIAVDAIVEDPAVSAQVGTANAEGGAQIGELLLEESGGEGEVGIVGALNSYIQNLRKDSFAETVTTAGAQIVQTVDGKNTQEGAASAAENLLTAQPGMNIVYATGEPALLGTVAAVQSNGAANRLKVFGWDLTKQAIDGIDAGFVAGVVQQDPKTEGTEAVKAAKALVDGQQVGKQIDVPVTIVTKDNVAPYRQIFS